MTHPEAPTPDNAPDFDEGCTMFRSGEFIDDKYRVRHELGRGGYGCVYLADEVDTGAFLGRAPDDEPLVLRAVAVKVLSSNPDPKRFSAEVRALCKLGHPAIVTVYGYGQTIVPTSGSDVGERTLPYLAMQYVEGEGLDTWMGARATESFQRTLGLLIQIADALGHAHSRGVVHRDLKPHNVLVGDDGVARIVDFGLSWLLRNDDPASQRVGTPGYLAPELLSGDDPIRDHRVDIYGFGALTYALFAGASPFAGAGLHATIKRQLASDWAFPDGFPSPLQSLVRRCLSRDPIDRPRAAARVAEELRRIASSPGIVLVDGRSGPSLDQLDALPERIDVRDARVVSVDAFEHPTRGAGVRFAVATDGDAPLRGFSYAEREGSAARQTHDVLSWAWPGAELSLYSVRAIANSTGERFAVADGSSVPVLEPYFPVTVTDVAKADGVRSGPCASRVLVDSRRRRSPGRALVVGSLAHDMLERMVRDDDAHDFDEVFDACLRRHRIGAIAADIGDDDIPKIRDELRAHFDSLARWTGADDETTSGRLTEVKRFSSRYGLEGRIDLAVVDADQTRILELKTGSFQSPEHERQLRCYTLMWDAVSAKAGKRVSGRLLYSKTGKSKPLVRREHEREREVVVARNDVVAMHRWFSDADTAFRPPSYLDDPSRCRDSPCKWRREECAFQSKLLGSMCGGRDAEVDREVWGDHDAALVHATRAYYFHFLRLIEREYRAASSAMGAVFRQSTVEERAARLRAVTDARLNDGAGDGRVEFACDAWGVFDVGDHVIAHRGDFDEEPCLSGRVVARGEGTLTLDCEGAESADTLPRDGWVLDQDLVRIGFRAMRRALFDFVASRDAARLERIVMPQRDTRSGQRGLPIATPAPARLRAEGTGAGELNDAQREAVAGALDAHDAFLVHGPPGTGKTTVIAELVSELVARGDRVLVAACTHTAVDNVLAKIVGAGVHDVVRVGRTRARHGDLERALTRAGRDPRAHFTHDLSEDAPSLEQLAHRLRAAVVVAATTNACVTDPTFDVIAEGDAAPFDVAIVDEASQLTEPLALAAINRARRFVLVGDDHQLPPVVTAADALSANTGEAESPLAEAGIAGLDRSLFARLRPFVPHVFLSTQYRMNASVQDMPNRAFYAGQLLPSADVAGRALRLDGDGGDAEMRARLAGDRPTVWVETEPTTTPRIHRAEAAQVVETARALIERMPDDPETRHQLIGVVAPFRAQCHAIRVGLREALGERAAAIEVDTVERFQGREKEVMLVSLVSSDWSEFVMNPHRLNVTLTRARSKVIVFGSREVRLRFADRWGPYWHAA